MKKVNGYPKIAPARELESDNDFPGYPEYSEHDDIFLKAIEEKDLDPEDITGKLEKSKQGYFDDLENDEAGSFLDIPGSELDDDLELTGNEDEENNYYSLSDNNIDDFEDIL
jgi:hypothetical protein